MFANQLCSHRATTLKGYVGEFDASRLFDRNSQDLVFLLRAGAAHLEGVRTALFHGIKEFLGRFVGVFGIHPQYEVVERQHRDRGQILPVERHAGGHRGGKQVGERDDDLVRIALGRLDLEETFSAGTTRFVHGNKGLLHQIVLGNDALDQPGHLVGTTAGACRNNEFNRLGRLPCSRRGRNRHQTKRCHKRQYAARQCSLNIHITPPKQLNDGLLSSPAIPRSNFFYLPCIILSHPATRKN